MITLKQIEAFRMIMISGSTTEAARLMNVSQPAVSRLLSSLEYELGFALFQRQNRQLKPTQEAAAFYSEVERSFLGLERLQRTADIIRQSLQSKFNLVSIPSLASNVCIELIALVAKRKPDLQISLDVLPSQALFERMSTSVAEIGITTLPISSSAVEKIVLATAPAVCLVPDGHPMAKSDEITPEALRDEAYIDYRRSSDFRKQVDRVFEGAQVERKILYEASATQPVVQLVAQGLGVAVVEPSFSKLDNRAGVTTVPFSPELPVELCIVHSKLLSTVGNVERFIHISQKLFSSSGSA